MVSLLESRNYRGLEWKHEVLADETHLTGIWLTMSRGLRFVYGLPAKSQT